MRRKFSILILGLTAIIGLANFALYTKAEAVWDLKSDIQTIANPNGTLSQINVQKAVYTAPDGSHPLSDGTWVQLPDGQRQIFDSNNQIVGNADPGSNSFDSASKPYKNNGKTYILDEGIEYVQDKNGNYVRTGWDNSGYRGEKAEKQAGACSPISGNFDIILCINQGLAWLGTLILGFFSLIVWLAGLLFDHVLKITVINFKQTVQTIGSINAAWAIGRDIANMVFIFLLLYAALNQIIMGEKADKIVKNVIIFAILVNFSLFFTNIMIDASNYITVGFYDKIMTQAEKQRKEKEGNFGGVAGILMNSLNLQSIYNVNAISKNENGLDQITKGSPGNNVNQNDSGEITPAKTFIITLGGSALMVIAAVILIATSVVFINRFVALILLMAFAPLAFLAMALPKDSYSGRFWEPLKKYCLFGPVYMIFLYITTTIIINGNFTKSLDATQNVSFAGLLTGDPNSIGLLLNFFVIIAFMMATLMIAQEIGVGGAALGKKVAGKLVGAATIGLAARAGRQTFGRLGNTLSNKNTASGAWLARKAAGTGFWSSVARKGVQTAQMSKEGSWDARNATNLGIDLGKGGGVGGFAKQQETIQKQAEAEVEQVGAATPQTQEKIRSAEAAVQAAISKEFAAKTEQEKKTAAEERKKAERQLNVYKKAATNETLLQQARYASTIGTGVDRAQFWKQSALTQARTNLVKKKLAGEKIDDDAKIKEFEDKLQVTPGSDLSSAAYDPKADEVLTILSSMKDDQVARLSTNILLDEKVVQRLSAGNLKSIRGKLSTGERRHIYNLIKTKGSSQRSAINYLFPADPDKRAEQEQDWT